MIFNVPSYDFFEIHIANEIAKGSVADVAHVIRKLKLACDVMEDALEEADSAYERLQEERERDEAVRIEA